jgi:hypothetical protein
MKKEQKVVILGIIAIVLAIIIGLIVYFGKTPQKTAQNQVANYQNYKFSEQEIAMVKKNEKGYFYYYAADGKRYVFPDLLVFKSWFGEYPIDKVAFEDVETMSKSPLGGNVTLRPGTLLQSPTLLNTFLVEKNGLIRPIMDEKLLVELYGANWLVKVIKLPDYYFSQYTIGKPIKDAADFPLIPDTITINQDKDLAK